MSAPDPQPQTSPPIDALLSPFQTFARTEAAGGIILLLCTALALGWANSPLGEAYVALWHTPVEVGFGTFSIELSLHEWINDALMAVFFFVVGLEIRREILVGELSTRDKAALPLAAAIGGMVVPALIYLAFNRDGPGASGWGIPMATDIAFALGVLALVGSRAPLGLKVFISALAIVDDIGAVLVIAFFYTEQIVWQALAAAAVVFVVTYGANRIGVRSPIFYAALGVLLWLAFLFSGAHATLAGIVAAFTIPARTRIDAQRFLARARYHLDRFEAASHRGTVLSNREQRAAVQALEDAAERVQSPMLRLELALLGWVAFVIVPVFALANAGVTLNGGGELLANPVALGIIGGLVIGKPVGVILLTMLALRLGIAALPAGVARRHVVGAGMLAGIGFTMSLFIAGQAFALEPQVLNTAKAAVLLSSTMAGVTGWFVLRGAPAEAAATTDARAPAEVAGTA